jgi:hypothetical protein
MNMDLPLLIVSLMVIVSSLVWDRATTVGPVLFAWAGAAVGGVVAFVQHYEPAWDRVGIEHIIPSATIGATCGMLPGFAVRAAYRRGSRSFRVALESFAAAALCGGLGLVVGWIVFRREENAIGSAFGYSVAFAAVGAILAILNGWLLVRPATAITQGGDPGD